MQKLRRTNVCTDGAAGTQQQRSSRISKSNTCIFWAGTLPLLHVDGNDICRETAGGASAAELMYDIILQKKRLTGSTIVNLFGKNS